jgi:hypothetical protein
MDVFREGDEVLGAQKYSTCESSRRLPKEPEDSGRGPAGLFQNPGESPGSNGEGRGVISVIAASAGELIAEPGDAEYWDLMLTADKLDLIAGGVGAGEVDSSRVDPSISNLGPCAT